MDGVGAAGTYMRSGWSGSRAWACASDAFCALVSARFFALRPIVRSYLCYGVECERGPALDVVVSSLSEGVVRADQDLGAAPSDSACPCDLDAGLSDILPTTGQLDRRQLLLTVLLERRAGFLDESRVVFGQGSDVWTM